MKYLFLLLSIVIIFGCKAPKIITETVTETKYRDTTIYIKIPPIYIDTTIYIPIPAESLKPVSAIDSVKILPQAKTAHAELNKEQGIIGMHSEADYYSLGNYQWLKIKSDAWLLDSTIEYNFRDTLNWADSIKIYNAIKEKTTNTTTTQIETIKYRSKFCKFTIWYFFLSMIALLIGVYIKFKATLITKSMGISTFFKNLKIKK